MPEFWSALSIARFRFLSAEFWSYCRKSTIVRLASSPLFASVLLPQSRDSLTRIDLGLSAHSSTWISIGGIHAGFLQEVASRGFCGDFLFGVRSSPQRPVQFRIS